MSNVIKYFHPKGMNEMAASVSTLPMRRARVPQPTFSVVYQFGKVASTSLVATLNKLENVEAKQSHFLGYPALNDALRNLSKPEVPDYFFNHQLGQLYENAILTRRVSAIRMGNSRERLLVISVARDPFSWFRSVILQDIVGNLGRFRNIVGEQEARHLSDGEVIAAGLHQLFIAFRRILETHGGVDEVVRRLSKDPVSVFGASGATFQNDSKLLLYTMLRPFNWFQKHFEPTLGLRVTDMEYANGVYRHLGEREDVFILNYEDIEQGFSDCLMYLGYQQGVTFERLNRSAAKSFSREIEIAFDTPEAQCLIPYFSDTEYARRHGYAHLGIPRNIGPFR